MTRSIKNATLLDADIPGLRKRILTNQTTSYEEADRYGVGVETIRRACRGETFRHIRDFLPEPRVPGEAPTHATAEEVPPPPSAEIEAVKESFKKFQGLTDASLESEDAIDFFVERRGKTPPTEGEGK